MTAISVSSKIGKEDLRAWDGINRTFDRRTSTGGVLTLQKYGDYVDVAQVFGGGTALTAATLATAAERIGSNRACMVLQPGAWTIDADLTIPANIGVLVPSGVTLDRAAGKTLTVRGPFDAGNYPIFSGTGLTSFIGGSTPVVYPEWFGADPTGAAPCADALTEAGRACAAHMELKLMPGGTYDLDTTTWTVDRDGIKIDARGATIQYGGTGYAVALQPGGAMTVLRRVVWRGGRLDRDAINWTVAGGGTDTTSVGFYLKDVLSSTFDDVSVKYFKYGMYLYGESIGGAVCGTSYVRIVPREFLDNWHSIHMYGSGPTGYVTQIKIDGGNDRFSYSVTDAACHIYLDDSDYNINGVQIQGCSLESQKLVQKSFVFGISGSATYNYANVIRDTRQECNEGSMQSEVHGKGNTVALKNNYFSTVEAMTITGTRHSIETSTGCIYDNFNAGSGHTGYTTRESFDFSGDRGWKEEYNSHSSANPIRKWLDTDGATLRYQFSPDGSHGWADAAGTVDTHLARGDVGQLQTSDQFIAQDGLATKVLAKAVVDGDFDVTPENGQLAVDSVNGRIYFRYGDAWHYCAKDAGFQINAGDAWDHLKTPEDRFGIGDIVLGIVTNTMSDGALHCEYVSLAEALKFYGLNPVPSKTQGDTLRTVLDSVDAVEKTRRDTAEREWRIQQWIDANPRDIEVSAEGAIETYTVEVEDRGRQTGVTPYHELDLETGETKIVEQPVFAMVPVERKRIRAGVRFDPETGKFFESVSPSREEAEAAIL